MTPAAPDAGVYLWRARAGTAIILSMGALACWTLASYYSAVKTSVGDKSAIRMDENRFAGLRAALPARGTIGYLSDTGGIRENARAYYLTQYFLAPIVVAPDPAHEFVVANLPSGSSIPGLPAVRGFTVERDFSNGVALLRRR